MECFQHINNWIALNGFWIRPWAQQINALLYENKYTLLQPKSMFWSCFSSVINSEDAFQDRSLMKCELWKWRIAFIKLHQVQMNILINHKNVEQTSEIKIMLSDFIRMRKAKNSSAIGFKSRMKFHAKISSTIGSIQFSSIRDSQYILCGRLLISLFFVF